MNDPVPLRKDAQTITVIGLAHGTSHFFHMLLPPLFPLFIRDFGFSYSQLGLLVTVFFAVSGVGQALSGFLVDRVGARPVLFVALSCFVLAALATASATSYVWLMTAAALAGIGNAAFHPVDFTILNKRVSQGRLGHAFAVHGITGNLGWAAAPAFLTTISYVTGSWRVAALGAGILALAVIAIVWTMREAIDDRKGQWSHQAEAAMRSSPLAAEHPLAFLRLPSVWLCFAFFFWSTCATSAIQGFAIPALNQLFGLPLSVGALVVTGYMLCGAAGMAAGGFLAARTQRLERVIGWCLLASAIALAVVATGMLGGVGSAVVAALAGAGAGLAGPSRDMLIKRASPPGATGRVYGTVYSGLDLGFAVASPVFGALLDRGMPSAIFVGASLALLMGVASASLISFSISRLGRRSKAAI